MWVRIGKGDLASEICCCGMYANEELIKCSQRYFPLSKISILHGTLLGKMGSGQSAPVHSGPDQSQSQNCPLVIVGLATQWPRLLMTHEDFDRYVCRWYNPEENPRFVSFRLRYCSNSCFTDQ